METIARVECGTPSGYGERGNRPSRMSARDKIKPLLKPTPNIDQIDEVQRDILERTADRNTEVVPDWLKETPTSGNTVKR